MSQSSRELSAQVLVVNRNLQAVHITTARRAFVLMFTDIARALDLAWVSHEGISVPAHGPVEVMGPSRVPRSCQAASLKLCMPW